MAVERATTLVIGASHAGLSLVTTLRELGDVEPIILVGAEPVLPYDRPPLSKSYLHGTVSTDEVIFRTAGWFADHDISVITGDEVIDISRDATGGAATTASGRTIEFTRLALTTGAANRPLGLPGDDLAAVLSLRDLADAAALRSALEKATTVAVIGGGFIGLEVAAAARDRGLHVTVIEATDRLLGRAVTPALSDFYRAAHERRGTRIMLSSNAIRVHGGGGRAVGVGLADGVTVPADLVVVGIGAAPRVELAQQLGLRTSAMGIVVDEHALTSDGITVAAGDCAAGPNPFARGVPGTTRLESVPHATDQARTAASTLLGHPAAYATVPWFWSDQGDLRLQIAGLVAGADETVVRGDVDTESFTLLSYREGRLIAGECLGTRGDYMAIKHGLEKGLTIDPGAALDVTTPLKRLLRPVD